MMATIAYFLACAVLGHVIGANAQTRRGAMLIVIAFTVAQFAQLWMTSS